MTDTPNPPRPLRVGLISLGCAKNLVDAEIMLGSLLKEGLEVTNNPEAADAVIVNTCSFVDAAQQESVDAILESAEVRKARNQGQALIVSGCLPQRFRNELPALLPEVDAFMGVDQVSGAAGVVRAAVARRNQRASLNAPESRRGRDRPAPPAARHVPPPAPLVEVNARPRYNPDFATPRFRLTPQHFAYVKIAEGCNHPCSFCIIPGMRGAHRSRPLADIVQEARQLVAAGVRELNLISQDSTYYGMDLRPVRSGPVSSPTKFASAAQALPANAATLPALLRALNDLPGDFWIRLLYTHPAHWTDELIRTIAACPKVARYVDMPLQHIHDNMLERMRRETSRAHIENLIRRIRAGIPGITLRTTFIVGFPGETSACFDSLLQFIRETRFERLGVFTYSKQEGTRAGRMEDQIPERIKIRRRNLAMAEQRRIARSLSAAAVGRNSRVLVERPAAAHDLRQADLASWEHGLLRGAGKTSGPPRGRYLVARSEADAPDIDGRVYVRGSLPTGEFARVRVVGHTDYDLVAEPA